VTRVGIGPAGDHLMGKVERHISFMIRVSESSVEGEEWPQC
jgi:hypothetical protein